MADVKSAYAASSAMTVTNLHSIASSATWVGGWESAEVDNSTNKYEDYLISGKLALGNAATAGEIRVYVVAKIDDSEWPDAMDGTESTATWTTTTIRDAAAVLGFSAATRADPGTDDVYPIHPFSVAGCFGGVCPEKFVVFVTHSTGVNLAASGSEMHQKGVYRTVT